MSKRIVLFIDGTGCNGLKDKDKTNVWKLHNACLEPQKQQLYLRGVGIGRFNVMGGLAGFGTRKRLEDAYNFLVKNHNKDGDHIFLFGFSRGALAVRLFADFLGHVGKLFDDPVNRKYLYRVYQIYEVSALLGAAAEFRAYMRHFGEGIRPLPIHFIGVWDTVEEYWSRGPRPDLEELPDHISVARHALALHERRSEMEPTLWKKWSSGVKLRDDQGPRVMQVWFPGAHSDVGGGYPAAESIFAEAALAWMAREARACGLNVSSVKPQPGAQRVLHQERTKNVPVGMAADWWKHGRPRSALSGFPNLDPTKDAQLIDSLYVDQTACDQILDPTRTIEFVHYPNNLFGGLEAKQKAKQDMRAIDGMALRMFLDLRALGKRSIK
jgi:uncharacterized protein (DUF2235 family)